jgi:hypothetical protein
MYAAMNGSVIVRLRECRAVLMTRRDTTGTVVDNNESLIVGVNGLAAPRAVRVLRNPIATHLVIHPNDRR